MIVKLTARQIPYYWNIIKFSAIKGDGVQEKDIYEYSKYLLVNLLNGKFQCFIASNEEKITKLLITAITYDDILNEKIFILKTLYSFEVDNIESWIEDGRKVYEYAKELECDEIRFTTRNKRIMEITEAQGFALDSYNYTMKL